MVGKLNNLEPQGVFQFFDEIAQIPHGSYNCKAIADYCEAFVQSHKYEYVRDQWDNIVVTVPPTAQYENAEPVMLQAHLDMVCEKTSDSTHNFETDPLDLHIDGDYIYAKNTTLGADDGIGVAMMLGILANPHLPHPKLYCIFTTEEEVGMDGATAIDLSNYKDAKYLINLDSEDDDTLLAGCAGGSHIWGNLPVRKTKAKGIVTSLKVGGLLGGHSGVEISSFGGNSNIIMGEVLHHLGKQVDFSLISINGGNKDNAIPRETIAEIIIGSNDVTKVEETIKTLNNTFVKLLSRVDKDLHIQVNFGESAQYEVFDRESQQKVIFFLQQAPNGVQAMNRSIDGLVDTSLNLGILETTEKGIELSFSIRSNKAESLPILCEKVATLITHLGGEYQTNGSYPPWEYKADSKLRTVMVDIYKEQHHIEPKIEVIHAGLECGIIFDKLPHLDMISIGPNMQGIHTTEEKLSISSTLKTWEYLLAVLKALR